ncbi:TRAP transporter small permease subunit [Brachymonas sp.]|uniref:TRAP transporter small permease subunit n=1 Tax=unclassified Brachymonas TaxID=2621329 RepID=UPI0035B1CB4B
MQWLMQLSRAIDGLNRWVGKSVIWLILASTLISAGNALVRKIFNTSTNAFLEIQWYLFAWSFLLAAAFTLLNQEHVKIDVLYSRLARRTQVWIDIFGFIFFLTPFCAVIMYYAIPVVMSKISSGEMSGNTGGLILWPVWIALPIGMCLLMLQGWSEAIKRVAFLRGEIPDPAEKSEEKTSEEELVEAIRQQTAEKNRTASAPSVH